MDIIPPTPPPIECMIYSHQVYVPPTALGVYIPFTCIVFGVQGYSHCRWLYKNILTVCLFQETLRKSFYHFLGYLICLHNIFLYMQSRMALSILQNCLSFETNITSVSKSDTLTLCLSFWFFCRTGAKLTAYEETVGKRHTCVLCQVCSGRDGVRFKSYASHLCTVLPRVWITDCILKTFFSRPLWRTGPHCFNVYFLERYEKLY